MISLKAKPGGSFLLMAVLGRACEPIVWAVMRGRVEVGDARRFLRKKKKTVGRRLDAATDAGAAATFSSHEDSVLKDDSSH